MTRTAKSALTIYDVSDGSSPSFTRYYSTFPGLLSEMGDPTTPGSGVTWTLASGVVPNTAYWIAERYTIAGGTPSAWQLMPVQAKDSGLPFIFATKGGFNKPVLGSATWITDAVAAVAYFTGRPYTNQKEFGYGTTVVIEYANGKLSGKYVRSGSSDTWVAPAQFIDGNLIVNGSIAAPQIDANAITAIKIDTDAITADKISANAITAIKIDTDAITADKISANAITAGKISANAITAGKISANAITADKISANAITADKIAAGSITATKVAVGSLTVDRLAINSSSITVAGNVINVASAALNREHYFPAGSSRWVLIPYLATKFTLTGCAAGGGRLGGVNPIASQIVSAGGGGGGGCNNFTGTLPSNAVYVIVTVGSGVVGGAGGNTVVYVATDINDQSTFQAILILGGGGVGTLAATASGFPGHIYTTGGAGGTSSPVVPGRIANGRTGGVGSSDGGEAMTGTGSTITDWVYGNSGPYTTNTSTGGEPLGNGCGAGGGSGLSHSLNGTFKNALAGGPGFMNVSFGT